MGFQGFAFCGIFRVREPLFSVLCKVCRRGLGLLCGVSAPAGHFCHRGDLGRQHGVGFSKCQAAVSATAAAAALCPLIQLSMSSAPALLYHIVLLKSPSTSCSRMPPTNAKPPHAVQPSHYHGLTSINFSINMDCSLRLPSPMQVLMCCVSSMSRQQQHWHTAATRRRVWWPSMTWEEVSERGDLCDRLLV